MEIKLMQNTKLSEMAVFKGESPNNRKENCLDKSLLVVFGDLISAQLETILTPDREKTKAVNLEERIKAEGEADYPSVVTATWYQQEFFGNKNSLDSGLIPSIKLDQESNFDVLNGDQINTVNPLNTVNIVDRTSDKAPDLRLLKEMDSVETNKSELMKRIFQELPQANQVTEEVGFFSQRVENEQENMPEKQEPKSSLAKHQILKSGGQIRIQEENQTKGEVDLKEVSQVRMVNEVDQVNVVNQKKEINHVNTLNQITNDAFDLMPHNDMAPAGIQNFDFNVNEGVFQEAPQTNQLTEEVEFLSQSVENEPENMPEKQNQGSLLSIGVVEEDMTPGKNIENRLRPEKYQILKSGGQIRIQEKNPTKNFNLDFGEKADTVGTNKIDINNGIFETSQASQPTEEMSNSYQRVVNASENIPEKQEFSEANEADQDIVSQKREVNRVNIINQNAAKTLGLSSGQDLENVQVKEFNVNKRTFQETIQVDQQTEEASSTYQKVAHEPENMTERQQKTLLVKFPHENRTGIMENEVSIGKNVDKQQIWNPSGQIKGQEESLTNNEVSVNNEVTRASSAVNEANQADDVKQINMVNQKKEISLINNVNQSADNNLDLDSLKESENIGVKELNINKENLREKPYVSTEKPVPGGAETKANQQTEEVGFRNSKPVEKDSVIGENMENQAIIVKDTVGQMKGWEEPPKNPALRMGLDKLPDQIEKLFQHVSIEKKHQSWELQLQPEKLGKLRIIVNWDKGKISAEFFVETGQTAKALENYLDNLKQNLGQKNIDVASLSITVAGQSSGGGSQGLPQPFSKKERGFMLRDDGFSLPFHEEDENILEGISINYLV